MDRSVIGLFNSLENAHLVIHKLVDAGCNRDQISLIFNDEANQYAPHLKNGDAAFEAVKGSVQDTVKAPEGAGFGAIVGGLTGLLVGLVALAIPGIGPVIAAGPLAAALGGGLGAVAGAATGGMTAGLIRTGLTEQEAQFYADGIQHGHVLVTVDTPRDKAQLAVTVMNANDAISITNMWRHKVETNTTQNSATSRA